MGEWRVPDAKIRPAKRIACMIVDKMKQFSFFVLWNTTSFLCRVDIFSPNGTVLIGLSPVARLALRGGAKQRVTLVSKKGICFSIINICPPARPRLRLGEADPRLTVVGQVPQAQGCPKGLFSELIARFL
ncbi:MAG: hypothetical protein V1871_06635 [Planctomycetota bacterium]